MSNYIETSYRKMCHHPNSFMRLKPPSNSASIVKLEFEGVYFAHNLDYGFFLNCINAVILRSTHNLCFELKLENYQKISSTNYQFHSHNRCSRLHLGVHIVYSNNHMSLVLRKPVFGVFDQVRHKPGCTATEDG